jgi:oligopeptide/dipeptide ABC transporter ATP-binding protein
MKILDVKNLMIRLSSHGEEIEAIRDLSISLFEGERLGIVGESGCGKTIFMKALLGLLPTTATIKQGEIIYKDHDLLKFSESQMQKIRGREIGMIFQDPMTSLNPTMKIGKQIAEGFIRHNPKATKKDGRQIALELLEQVGIPEPELRLDQYPHLLSGGIRQRALIALALAAEPQILIADEPTTALDVTVQAQILELLQHLQKKKSTILITHDLSLVAAFCDRVAVMYAGQIVEEADVETLFAHPRHPYTQKLLESIPRLDQRTEKLTPIPGCPPDLATLGPGCAFCNRCPQAMTICHEQSPPLINNTRCWLYDSSR